MVLPSFYLAPARYYAQLQAGASVVIDTGEHFVKQTYRNRCIILSPAGPLNLIIPVEHGDLSHRAMKDVRLSRHSPWQRNHWHALCTCYNSSPFFEFYGPDLEPLYTRRWEWLTDFNEALRSLLCRWLFVDTEITLSLQYTGTPPPPFPEGELSVVHLLFNYGNEAMLHLHDYEN